MSKSKVSKPAAKKVLSSTRTTADPTSNPASMKTSEIRDLIDFISKSGLNEVNIETKELKISVKRDPDQKIFKSSPSVTQTAPIQPAIAMAQPSQTVTKPETPSVATSGKKTIEIKSPMIGTFYRSSNPDTPAFVSVGDKITKGQTVCIIEAMKLFNEIEAEISGTVVKIPLENATPVEYDQVLFVVEPD